MEVTDVILAVVVGVPSSDIGHKLIANDTPDTRLSRWCRPVGYAPRPDLCRPGSLTVNSISPASVGVCHGVRMRGPSSVVKWAASESPPSPPLASCNALLGIVSRSVPLVTYDEDLFGNSVRDPIEKYLADLHVLIATHARLLQLAIKEAHECPSKEDMSHSSVAAG